MAVDVGVVVMVVVVVVVVVACLKENRSWLRYMFCWLKIYSNCVFCFLYNVPEIQHQFHDSFMCNML